MSKRAVRFEVCTESLEGAIAAQKGGADRVELCSCLVEGGVTPSHGLLKLVREALDHTLLMVMIRPRAGDFIYTQHELQTMEADIRSAAELGADGVVFGLLLPDGSVDKAGVTQLLSLCRTLGLDATFHRAYDLTSDFSKALEDLIECRMPRVLTSGGRSTCLQGADVIAGLVRQAAGRICIAAGAGLHEGNVKDILARAGPDELHGSARMIVRSISKHPSSRVTLTMSGDWEWWVTSEHKVRAVKTAIAAARQQPPAVAAANGRL